MVKEEEIPNIQSETLLTTDFLPDSSTRNKSSGVMKGEERGEGGAVGWSECERKRWRLEGWWDNWKEGCKRAVLPFHWVSLIQPNQIIYCWGNTCTISCTTAACVCVRVHVHASHTLAVVFVQFPVHSGAGPRPDFSYQEDFLLRDKVSHGCSVCFACG